MTIFFHSDDFLDSNEFTVSVKTTKSVDVCILQQRMPFTVTNFTATISDGNDSFLEQRVTIFFPTATTFWTATNLRYMRAMIFDGDDLFQSSDF